jgi:hypothetical protein
MNLAHAIQSLLVNSPEPEQVELPSIQETPEEDTDRLSVNEDSESVSVEEEESEEVESEEVDECNDKDILEKFYDEENLSDYFYNHNDEIIDEYNKKIDEYNPNKKSYEQIKVGEEIEIPDLDLVELKNTISESIGKKVCINEDKGDESIVYVDRR